MANTNFCGKGELSISFTICRIKLRVRVSLLLASEYTNTLQKRREANEGTCQAYLNEQKLVSFASMIEVLDSNNIHYHSNWKCSRARYYARSPESVYSRTQH